MKKEKIHRTPKYNERELRKLREEKPFRVDVEEDKTKFKPARSRRKNKVDTKDY